MSEYDHAGGKLVLFDHKSPCMDNFKVSVVSRCREHLELALKLLWAEYSGPSKNGNTDRDEFVVTHFSKTGCSLRLRWSHDLAEFRDFKPLPVPLDFNETVSFIVAFLKSAEYAPQPDHDGDNTKGFTISNDPQGIWEGDCILVQPEWAMHGK